MELGSVCVTSDCSFYMNEYGDICIICTYAYLYFTGKMVLSTYEKKQILFYHRNGLAPSQILSALKVENIVTT